MNLLQRLLLLPCLSPLLAVLIVAALNTGQPTALRLLTWRSGRLPIGAWIAISASGSALFTALAALSTSAVAPPLRRQVHRSMGWEAKDEQAWRPESESTRQWRASPQAAPQQSSAWPERDLRDPAPTVAVPFRVIKRGKPASSHGPTQAPDHAPTAAASTMTDEDWDQPLSDDW